MFIISWMLKVYISDIGDWEFVKVGLMEDGGLYFRHLILGAYFKKELIKN